MLVAVNPVASYVSAKSVPLTASTERKVSWPAIRTAKNIAVGQINVDTGVFVGVYCPVEAAAPVDHVVAAAAFESFRAARVIAAVEMVVKIRAAHAIDAGKRIVPDRGIAVRRTDGEIDGHGARWRADRKRGYCRFQ